MRNLLLSLIISALALACAPRGEYKSVDTLLKIAKERYAQVANVDSPVSKDLKSLASNLEALPNEKQIATEIAAQLRQLNKMAGYTSRPAISELVLQYEAIAKETSNKMVTEASLKLIASRTFNLLASELQSTAFRLS